MSYHFKINNPSYYLLFNSSVYALKAIVLVNNVSGMINCSNCNSVAIYDLDGISEKIFSLEN